MIDLADLAAAALVIATPLVFAASGELVAERAGVLNLGIEGTMYAGAFIGFVVADRTGSTLGRAAGSRGRRAAWPRRSWAC